MRITPSAAARQSAKETTIARIENKPSFRRPVTDASRPRIVAETLARRPTPTNQGARQRPFGTGKSLGQSGLSTPALFPESAGVAALGYLLEPWNRSGDARCSLP